METLDAAEVLSALGHESRLAIFRVLVEARAPGMNAGAMPSAASTMARRFEPWQEWNPGPRAFAFLMLAAVLWWIAQGVELTSG